MFRRRPYSASQAPDSRSWARPRTIRSSTPGARSAYAHCADLTAGSNNASGRFQNASKNPSVQS